MPKSIEAQGVTVDEAIQTALNLLGLGRDSVEIEIIHHPRSGFLGIGARRAKVRATMREQVMKDGEEFDMAPDAGSRGRRRRRSSRRRTPRGGGEQKARESRPGTPEPQGRRPASDARVADVGPQRQRGGAAEGEGGPAERPAGGEQRGRARGRRGGRGRGGAERRTQDELAAGPPTESGEGDAAGPEMPVSERPAAGRSRSREQAAAKRLDPEALRSRALQLTDDLIRHMGVDATVSVRVEDGGSIAVTIDAGEDGAVLIGRRGTTLDALEHIVNRMTTGADPAARVRVTLDVCGYRERRKATLGDVAVRLKQHALSTMRRVQITPLSPHDRIIFQEALAGDDSVTTRIVGSGFYRRVLVIPRGQESDGSVAEEFNEEGQITGYPAPGGPDEDSTEEPSEEIVYSAGIPQAAEPQAAQEEPSENAGKPPREES